MAKHRSLIGDRRQAITEPSSRCNWREHCSRFFRPAAGERAALGNTIISAGYDRQHALDRARRQAGGNQWQCSAARLYGVDRKRDLMLL
jgi:hypothetical protein